MANLNGSNIGTNYKGILNLDSTTINTNLDATLRAITDGDGNASPLQLSTDAVSVGAISGASLGIKGSGTTTSTTSLLVQNSAGVDLLRVNDSASLNTLIMPSAKIGTFNFVSNTVIENTAIRLVATTGGVSVNSSYGFANASSILDVSSTTKGFLPPRMTTTQKNAIASPAAGLVVYDSTTNKLACYNGTTWNDLF